MPKDTVIGAFSIGAPMVHGLSADEKASVSSSLIISLIFPFGTHPVRTSVYAGRPRDGYKSVGRAKMGIGVNP